MDELIAPTQLTLATNDTSAMVQFYSAVFGISLQPVPAHATTLYRGTLHTLAFVLCPNSLAGVEAQQSRHQFTYGVRDLDALLARAVAAGGLVHEQTPANGRLASVVILDPDGNSLVFVQATS